ncbi:DUF4238 domain-containing protein [Fodinibius sp.]|uniref:DUF4238 domain-containing protein n=1 Tax=Fodinibius sp. TaxID=1872440 RepID=UPI002ACE429F|nr:DUF4238 domain-containing protein [Fodinibius sp.]MDZ7659497.1 DUF4238 domain-containing protein [Fodinibius sp.]
MSGSRQHFIPQFLQKGFASHSEGEEIYTWVFRKEGEPFNPNIKNIGVEGDFYTFGDDSTADDLITDAESEFGELLHFLREESPTTVKAPLIPELIAHLEVTDQTPWLNFQKISEMLVRQLNDFITDEDLFLNYAKRQAVNSDSYIYKELVDRLVQDTGYDRKNAGFLLKMYSSNLGEMIDKVRPFLPEIAKKMSAELSKEKIKSLVKSGHVDILKKTIAPEVRKDIYEDFSYRIIEFENEELIQGDAPVLFKIAGEEGYTTFIDKTVELKAVLLPLSPNKLLLGGEHFNPKESIPDIIARNSLEYFITANKNSKMFKYQNLIGSDANLLTKEEVEELAFDIFTE